MDKACLVTFLGDSFLIPNVFLQDYIEWKEIDDDHAKAIISYYGIKAEGIFTFNSSGEILSFSTNDRMEAASDGTMEYVPWTIICDEYREAPSKIKYPTKVKAIWNYKDGDFTYFDCSDMTVAYNR